MVKFDNLSNYLDTTNYYFVFQSNLTANWLNPMSRSSSDPLSLPQTGDLRILLRSLRYLRPYWKLATGAYLTLILINVLSLIMPQVIKVIIDVGIDGHDMQFLVWAVLGLLGLTALRGVIT